MNPLFIYTNQLKTKRIMDYNYAIQFKSNGHVLDYCETKEQAEWWLENYPVELVSTNLPCIKVTYTELGCPHSYGHQEESFVTYGGFVRCLINLYKWMQETARTFGPDARDIKDYFRHCSVIVNGKDRTEWMLKQVNKINIEQLYV